MWRKTLFIFIALLLLLSFSKIFQRAEAAVPENVLKQQNTVVMIEISNYFEKGDIALGTGFIIDPNGIIVTNYHVVSDWINKKKKNAIAKLENGTFMTLEQVLAVDKENDIAIIKSKARQLPMVNINKRTLPKRGENIYVIGSPLGIESTLSEGIISNISQENGLIQISSPVSPGNSGSPVFNSRGEVIAIVTFLLKRGQNLNFAVPTSKVLHLFDAYKEGKIVYTPAKITEVITRSGPFAVYDDGTVIDERTKLMWADKDNGNPLEWNQAKQYCDNYRGGGYTDWRMPTQDELKSLYGKGNSRNVYRNVIHITGSTLWTHQSNNENTNIFLIEQGEQAKSTKSNTIGRVLPVRGGR